MEIKPKQKKRGGSWKPGQSGNPGGRAAMPPELRELARAKGPAALQIALDLMDNATSEAVRLAAAREVLDRGYGKAQQFVDATSGGEPIPISIIRIHAIDEAKTDD
jgi:hypothetical protein